MGKINKLSTGEQKESNSSINHNTSLFPSDEDNGIEDAQKKRKKKKQVKKWSGGY